jgi:predicted dehydrogenase
MMHLPLLRKRPDCFHLVALSDISRTLLRSVGALYNVPSANQFRDYHDLVNCQELEAVFILNGGSHAPQVLAAIEAGKHVLVEKPLCYTLREADEIAAAAERMRVVVMVAYMKRYDPGYRAAKTLLAGMEDVRYVQINTLHPAEDGYLSHHNVMRLDDAPGEVVAMQAAAKERLLDEAIGASVPAPLRKVYSDTLVGSMVHDVNALRGLLGEPDCVLSTEIWPVGDPASVTTTLGYGDRTRVVITWTLLERLRDYFEEIAVMAPAHRLRIQFPSPYLAHFPTPVIFQSMEGGAMTEKRITVSYDEAFGEEQLAFRACVTQGHAPLTSIADARRDVALLQQIFARFQPSGLGGEAARGQDAARRAHKAAL